jgi:Cys-tRNA(Pro)/Cys-tRNA(Cys) deacylase
MTAPSLHPRILNLVAAFPHFVHVHPPVLTVEQAASVVPELVVDLVKTIAFRIDGTPRIVLAAVAARAAVDYKKLAQVIHCNRRALRLMPATEVLAELGCEVGALGPFPVTATVDVIVDQDVLAQTRLRCGAGLRTHTLEIAPADLVRASAAQVASIAKAVTR